MVNYATRRLVRDLRELQEHPQPGLSAAPVHPERSLFTWHANLVCMDESSALFGAVMHVEMVFPDTYPDEPPSCRLLSPLRGHPNVFGDGYICADMLKSATGPFSLYSAWSPGYSAMSVCMQLSSFFYAARVDQQYGSARESDACWGANALENVQRSREWACPECCHDAVVPWPPLPTPSHAPAAAAAASSAASAASAPIPASASASTSTSPFPLASSAAAHSAAHLAAVGLSDMPQDALNAIFAFLPDPRDLCSVARANKGLLDAVRRSQQWIMRELQCYRSKVFFREAVLGVGVFVLMGGNGGRIRSVSVPYDLLAADSFSEGCRRGAWGEPVNAWVPILIDAEHMRQGALPLACAAVRHLASLTGGGPASEHDHRGLSLRPPPDVERWKQLAASATASAVPAGPRAGGGAVVAALLPTPAEVLFVLPKLLNAQVVAMMKADESSSSRLSDRALLGFCSFHHLFSKLAAIVPGVQQEAERRIDAFLSDEKNRDKEATPDLGEWLALLCVSSQASPGGRHDWASRVAIPFLRECFARNVRWLFEGDRELPSLYAWVSRNAAAAQNAAPGSEVGRWVQELLRRAAAGSATSRRVVLFQVAFLRCVARPCGATPAEIAEFYEKRLGRPTARMHAALRKASAEAERCTTWPQFFEQVGLKPVPDAAMLGILIEAANRSETKKYHGGPSSRPPAGGRRANNIYMRR